MTFQIQDIVLHQLVFSEETGYQLQLRQQPVEFHSLHATLLSELVRVHQQRSKVYAIFESDEPVTIQTKLEDYLGNTQNFLSWSQQMMQDLLAMLEDVQYHFITQSVVMFCRYRELTTDYLLVAFIESQSSPRITESLEIQDTHYLNIAQSDKIMLLDLTQWNTAPELARYFSVATGRIGRRVADFFINWWQLKEGLNTKQQTSELIKAVNDYCVQNEFSNEGQKQCKQQVYSYCEAQAVLDEDVAIEQLSQHLVEQLPQTAPKFSDFVQQQGYPLATHFPVAKQILKQLKIYKGSAKGLAIRFDAELLGEQVVWDAIADELVIHGLPSSLRKQLLEQKPVLESLPIVLDE